MTPNNPANLQKISFKSSKKQIFAKKYIQRLAYS